jgi:integrase
VNTGYSAGIHQAIGLATAHITDSAISKASRLAKETKARIELTDCDQEGLRLRANPGGGKTWYLACRDANGKYRLFLLGAYPGLTISDAREAARGMRERVRQGDDPTAEKRRAKALGMAGEVSTLHELLDAYGASGDAPRSWPASEARIRKVFSKLLKQPLKKLTAADIQIAADIWKSKVSASFVLRSIRPALRWGAKRNYVRQDVSDISASSVPVRERVLSKDELKSILRSLDKSGSMYAKVTRFIMWTVSRRGEAETARWRDVDLDTGIWTIPRTKNGKAHVLKLPRQALEFLKSHQGKKVKEDELVFPNENGNKLTSWDVFAKSIKKNSKTAGWHRHDLRRTGATILGELGVDPHIIESALNHAVIHSSLSNVYNKSRYSVGVADALQQLADFYDSILRDAGSEPTAVEDERTKQKPTTHL